MNRIRLHSAALLLLILLAAAGPSLGALQADAAGAPDGSTAVSAAQDDGGLDPIEARRLRFLAWGYAVIWILLAAYLVSIAVRLRSVRREIEGLRQRLEGGGSPPRRGASG